MKIVRDLYNWTLNLARHRRAGSALFGVSFAESSFFPIPPDIMLIPMVIAERRKAFYYAALCTLGSVLGGLFGYAIGYFLFDSFGRQVFEFYGYLDAFERFKNSYNDYGIWIVFIAGVTPIPYKVVTIASGVALMNLPLFIIASALSRGLRFFIVSGLLYKFGAPIQAFIEKHLSLLFSLFCVLLIGGFLAIKFLV
jgi:membrane protein YqaA with SNARE-associated domain